MQVDILYLRYIPTQFHRSLLYCATWRYSNSLQVDILTFGTLQRGFRSKIFTGQTSSLSRRRCFIVRHGCKETACRLMFFTFGTFLRGFRFTNFTGQTWTLSGRRCFIVPHGCTDFLDIQHNPTLVALHKIHRSDIDSFQ